MITPKKTVYAVPGRRVVDPNTKEVVGPEGFTVEWGSYWMRRIQAGDVTLTAPAKPAATADQTPAEQPAATADQTQTGSGRKK